MRGIRSRASGKLRCVTPAGIFSKRALHSTCSSRLAKTPRGRMGCVASTADISEPESSPNKASVAPASRTLLTSANSPKGEEGAARGEQPNFKHAQTLTQDVTSPISPGKSILRSKSFQGLSTKESGRRATFDTAAFDEEERSMLMADCRSEKRRVTLGQAEVREYRVQMTQSRSF